MPPIEFGVITGYPGLAWLILVMNIIHSVTWWPLGLECLASWHLNCIIVTQWDHLMRWCTRKEDTFWLEKSCFTISHLHDDDFFSYRKRQNHKRTKNKAAEIMLKIFVLVCLLNSCLLGDVTTWRWNDDSWVKWVPDFVEYL